uniref:Thyrotropin subunit beta n=1 Tax=Cynoglossus semilaevis TaxID=244447 RepID=A0A3P8WC23_CYNSE
METSVFNSWLLFLLFSPAVPMCLPTDFTMYVEKPECDYCVAVNTTICEGFCYSRTLDHCIGFLCVKGSSWKSWIATRGSCVCLFRRAAPSTPTPSSPIPWLLAAAAAPAQLRALTALTEAAVADRGAPNQSDTSTRTLIQQALTDRSAFMIL